MKRLIEKELTRFVRLVFLYHNIVFRWIKKGDPAEFFAGWVTYSGFTLLFFFVGTLVEHCLRAIGILK